MSARGAVEALRLALLLAAAAGAAGCRRAEPVDPEAHARHIVAECADDAVCVRERWRRDPRDWSLGLRAEVAGRGPRAPLVVETTREILAGDLRESPCFSNVASEAPVYYRTAVALKETDQFPFAVFGWERFEDALAGHRRVVAAVAKARGDAETLWRGVEKDTTLDRACVRFRDKRDRCAT